MKKIINMFVALALCSAVFAGQGEPTTVIQIKLTPQSGPTDVISLLEWDQYSPEFKQGEESTKSMPDGNAYVYTVVEGKDCAVMGTNNLEGTYLTVKANASTSYTFSVAYIMGRALYLKDHLLNKLTPITSDMSYSFTLTANSTVSDRFEITAEAPEALFHDRAVAAGNWGTICYPELITSVEGAVVYEIAGRNADATEIVAAEVAVADMMAGKPYLFNATADAQKFYYNPNETTSLQAGANGLTGTFEQTTLGTDGYYVVKGQSFIPALGTSTVLANRAYLALTDITQMDVYQEIAGVNVRRFSVVRGATTGNGNVNADMNANGKYIMNGRFVIIREGQEYNALGF